MFLQAVMNILSALQFVGTSLFNALFDTVYTWKAKLKLQVPGLVLPFVQAEP